MHAKRREFFLFRQYGKLDICIAQKIPPTIIKQQNDRFCRPGQDVDGKRFDMHQFIQHFGVGFRIIRQVLEAVFFLLQK